MKKIISVLINVVLCFFILVNICFLYSKLINKSPHPKFMGWSMAVVVSGSMADTINVDDVVIIKEENEYHVGDIISYASGAYSVTHRIVEENETGFVTKGDANNAEDGELVKKEMIYGRVQYIIPRAGAVIGFFQTPFGMLCLLVIAFLMIELPAKRLEKKEKAADETTEK